MAAYASTVTLYTRDVQRISRDLGLIAGRIDVTNYNPTTTEETGITRYFKASSVAAIAKGIVSLQITSSENGYLWGFDKATGKFKIYRSAAYTPSLTVKNGTIGSNMTIGLTADAVTASLVGGTGITADRTLTTNNPIAALSAAALSELAADVDAGTADFIAIGFIAGSAR